MALWGNHHNSSMDACRCFLSLSSSLTSHFSVASLAFSSLIKKSWKEIRKRPHPLKPPHVPFSSPRLLCSHDPLTKASSPVEYHMLLVKPMFLIIKGNHLPSQKPHSNRLPTLDMSQNISNRWGFKLIYNHNKRAQHFSNIVSNFKLSSVTFEIEFRQPLNCGCCWWNAEVIQRVPAYSSKDLWDFILELLPFYSEGRKLRT